MTDIKQTESEKLLNEIEQLLNPIRKRAKYVEYGVKSKPETDIPSTQLTMNFKGFEVKVIVKRI